MFVFPYRFKNRISRRKIRRKGHLFRGKRRNGQEILLKKERPGSFPGLSFLPLGYFKLYPPMTAAIWKMARYMAMTRPPTVMPRKTIKAGSIREVRAATAVSTSSS